MEDRTLAGVKALVVGMAKSGFAAVELLKKHGADVRATDLKPREKLPPIDVPFAPQSPEVFEGADLIVTSPDVPADLPALEAARQRGVEVIGDVELSAPFLQGKIIAITGSNGK